jgi:hypothetical protein
MKAKRPTSTQVSTSITHDRLSVKAKFPTGGTVRFSITRSGEQLGVAGSNDPATAKLQLKAVAAWIERLRAAMKGQELERGSLILTIAATLREASSVGQLVAKI